MRNKKLQVWLPLIFSIVMIAGMYLGYQLSDQAGKGFFGSGRRGSLQEALDLIKLKYVDPVPVDSLENSAIEEIMSRLDPHSVYFPPVELKEANEDLAGNFEGIGVEFNLFNDTVNVVFVIPNGPSDKAGLQIGDKIISVNDSSLTSRSFSVDEIKQLIRGERGSKVVLRVKRGAAIQTFSVTRGRIPVSSIDAAYMIDKTNGYIKLNKFTETSYEEFMRSMEQLQQLGLQQLILDLRGNGGGFMNEAVDIADEFLDGDKLIVYTEGLHSKKREYRCKRRGLFEQGKLVVLLDELSASASEVLAGALQDWCRATIIGRRSFGKGLVQEQYPLSDGSAIRLTVARYYTPQGRSIQRSYEKGKKIYLDEILERYTNGEVPDTSHNKPVNGKIYRTVCGDTVYGGGGISPDVYVPIDTNGFQRNIARILLDINFNNFVYNYYLKHRQEVDRYSSPGDFAIHFSNEEGLWNEFVSFTGKDSLGLANVLPKEKEFLQKRLKASLARFRWRNPGLYEVLNSDDLVIRKAIEVMK